MSPALPAVSFMEREIVSYAVISNVKWEPVRAEHARSRSHSGDAAPCRSGKDGHEATGLEQGGEAHAPLVGNQRDAVAAARKLGRQGGSGNHMATGSTGSEDEVAFACHRPLHRTI